MSKKPKMTVVKNSPKQDESVKQEKCENPELEKQMALDPAMAEEEARQERIAQTFKESDKALEITETENTAALPTAGVRGQIKKILRVFRDDFRNFVVGLESQYKASHNHMIHQLAGFQNNVIQKVNEIDEKHKVSFQWLFSNSLRPLDAVASEAFHTVKVLLNHLAVLFYVNSRQHVDMENKIKSLMFRLDTIEGKNPRPPEYDAVDDGLQEQFIKGFKDEINKAVDEKIDKILADREAKKKAEEEARAAANEKAQEEAKAAAKGSNGSKDRKPSTDKELNSHEPAPSPVGTA